MLGAEHAIRQPAGLKASSSAITASMALWLAKRDPARTTRSEVEAALDRHEPTVQTDDAEYLAAQQVYYDLHVCRVVPNPPEVLRTTELLDEDPTVYNVMNGPNEFFASEHCATGASSTMSTKSQRRRCSPRADSTRRRPPRAAVLRQHSGRALGDLRNSSHMPLSKNRTLPRRRRGFLATMTSEVVVKK